MQVLSLVNQKGGCGKTTAAVNLAGALAARGERVLLVDLDPQAHATLALGWAPGTTPELLDVLRERVPLAAAVHQAPGDVALLPATLRLAEFEETAARTLEPERVLAKALARVEDDFDVVLLDCPPRVDGVLAANALGAADVAVLVVETGAFALQGAVQARRLLDAVRADRGLDFDVRVLGTLFDRRTRFAREVLIALQARFGREMFETVLRTSVRLREVAALGAPVQVVDPACRAAADFAALADELSAWIRSREGAAAGASRSPRSQAAGAASMES